MQSSKLEDTWKLLFNPAQINKFFEQYVLYRHEVINRRIILISYMLHSTGNTKQLYILVMSWQYMFNEKIQNMALSPRDSSSAKENLDNQQKEK